MKCHVEVVDQDAIIHVFKARCSLNSSVRKTACDRDDESTLETSSKVIEQRPDASIEDVK